MSTRSLSLNIPLEQPPSANVTLRYVQQEDGSWVNRISDEVMRDLMRYWSDGSYQVSTTRAITLK